MTISLKGVTFAAAIAMASLVTTQASAEQTLKATWTDPDDVTTAPVAAFMHVFQDSLQRLSGGEWKVELYPNSQLGNQRAMVQQVARGSLQFANIGAGVLAALYYPKLSMVDMPFLFKSRAHFEATMTPDQPFIKAMFDEVAKETGIRILALHPYGFRSVTTRDTAIHSPADMKGVRIRTMEIIPHQKMMEALGATPVPMPFLELYTSLQTGVVDGQENTPTNVVLQRFYQVQHHMTLTQHVMTVGALITNDHWYQSLTDAQRKAIQVSLKEACLAHDGLGAIQDLVNVQKIRDEGVDVYALSPEEREAFRQATMGPVRAWAEDEFGKDFVNQFFDYMASFDDRF